MGDSNSPFQWIFELLLFYHHEIQSLSLANDDAFLRRNHIMGAIRRFRDERRSFAYDVCALLDKTDDPILTGDDAYKTAAAALWLLLNDVDAADQDIKGNVRFLQKVRQIIKNGEKVHKDGVPQKISIVRGNYCKVTLVKHPRANNCNQIT